MLKGVKQLSLKEVSACFAGESCYDLSVATTTPALPLPVVRFHTDVASFRTNAQLRYRLMTMLLQFLKR